MSVQAFVWHEHRMFLVQGGLGFSSRGEVAIWYSDIQSNCFWGSMFLSKNCQDLYELTLRNMIGN